MVIIIFLKNKNKLKTIEAQIVQKLENNEPPPNFIGSYTKKRVFNSTVEWADTVEYATRPFPYTHEPFVEKVSHEKALHNYFIRCLNLRKIYGNFRKLQKRFNPVIEELL